MLETNRPDPDALLASLQKERQDQGKGKLKIFFGMAAGVGKTYSMLLAAREASAAGQDVVVGYVESHGRPETDALLNGLQTVPPLQLEHNGLKVSELNLDAVIARHPEIVLIDELAHTNAQGCRHSRRYHDVIELLEAGISVWTTLNVQHVSSQTDTVQEITGIKIRETVPDSVIDLADSIEVIDLEPIHLIKRLKEGKVYRPEGAQRALANFFKIQNLTALREMAFNVAARRINRDISDYLQKSGIEGPWKTREKLMVAISPSPQSRYWIRWVRRLASNLHATWLAVYVNPMRPLSSVDEESLASNMALARELGAEVISTPDQDLVEGLLRVARRYNVSQIVVGRSYRKKRWFARSRDLIQRLIDDSGSIDIHIVTEPLEPRKEGRLPRQKMPLREYYLGAAILFVLGLSNYLAQPYINYWTTGLLFLATVSFLGLYLSRGAILFVATLSALGWNWFFIPPLYQWRIGKLEDTIMFLIYFLVALVSGQTTSRLKRRQIALMQREFRLGSLYELTAALSRRDSIHAILEEGAIRLQRLFRCRVAFLLAGDTEGLQREPVLETGLSVSDSDYAVALWVLANSKKAGQQTATMKNLDRQFIPLIGPNGSAGVLIFKREDNLPLPHDQVSLLETIAAQIAMALEREKLDEQKRKMVQQEESERISRLLLSTVSHELRTPIAAIQSAAATLFLLLGGKTEFQDLTREILKGARRLDRLVRNLLEMHRIESAHTRLKLEYHDVTDLIGATLEDLKEELADRKVELEMSRDNLFIRVDFILMMLALSNLLLNAHTYSPKEKPIYVHVDADAGRGKLRIQVEDRGPGIHPEDQEHIFEKFYRGKNMEPGGSGLGLSIARGIVELHDGAITARNAPQGGAIFQIELNYEPGKDLNRR